MEQDVGRWLSTQLGYNASTDSSLSSNCRGNLKGLWEFVLNNYKTADSKCHIQNVLVRHRKEQELARREPEQQKEAEGRRYLLRQLQNRNAELEQTLASLQAGVTSKVQEAADQVAEQSILQHDLLDKRAQAVLLQAYMHRGQQLLEKLQALQAQLQQALEWIRGRCRNSGNAQVYQDVLQRVETLSSTVTQGLLNAVEYIAEHYGVLETDTDVRHQLDQRHGLGHSIDQLMPSAAGSATNYRTSTTASSMPAAAAASSQQQQSVAAVAGNFQPLLGLCKLLHAYQLPPDVAEAALQLLQVNPSAVWDTCTQLAHHNLMELTAQLDEAESAMLAPLYWPGSSSTTTTQQSAANHQDKPDQQQHVLPNNSGFGSSKSRYQLPWSSGLSLQSSAEGMQELGVSPPPEVRVKMRLKAHLALHVQTAQALQRARAAQQELDGILASTPLLLPALAVGTGSASALTWQAELAQLYMHAAQERAKVQLLQQYEQQYKQELEELLEIKDRTEEKVLLVRNQMAEDLELNHLLHVVAEDTVQLEQALTNHRMQVLQLLGMQLLPLGTATAETAQEAVGKQQKEINQAGKLPLLDLASPHNAAEPESAGTGKEGSGVIAVRGTLQRFQQAARQLLLSGRSTTGPITAKGAAQAAAGAAAASTNMQHAAAGWDAQENAVVGNNRRLGDAATTAALKGAAALDAVASLRCPAFLLMDIAECCKEARGLEQRLDCMSAASTSVAAHSRAASQQEHKLQEKVTELHQRERQEVLLQLQALQEEGQAARNFAQDQLMVDLKQLWEMPAMHLVPHRTYQGKNCSQWLLELQHLHAQKEALVSHTTQPHAS